MNINYQLNKKISEKKREKLMNSSHIVDCMFYEGALTNREYNAFFIYERFKNLLARHRSIKTRFLTSSQSWGKLPGFTTDDFENQELERFWLWVEKRIKGRALISFLDHTVATGTSQCKTTLIHLLRRLYQIFSELSRPAPLKAA